MIRFCQDCNQESTDTSWSDHFGTRLCVGCYNARCDAGPVRCEECFGEGKIERPAPQHDDPYYASVVPCGGCDGYGWM